MSQQALSRVTDLLNSACADREGLGPLYPHARVAVVKGGKRVFDETACAAGFERPGDDSIYRWYSMTKIVTSIAVMQCYERGLLSPTDPVAGYIPAFGETRVYTGAARGPAPEPVAALGIAEVPTALETEPQATPMTVAQLMTHTSGLGYGGLWLPLGVYDDVDLWYMLHGFPLATVVGGTFGTADRCASLAGACDLLAAMPLKFQPGTRWEYGVGHVVCGRIVEVVTGLDFLTYLERHIFAPLGMTSAGMGEAAQTCPQLLKLYAYGPNEGTAVKFDLSGPRHGRALYDTAATGHLVEAGSTQPPELHVDHCKRPEFIRACKARTAPVFGDCGMTGRFDDYFQIMCMLVNRGRGANGSRVLGAQTVQLMFQNHLPGGRSIGDLENAANAAAFRGFSDALPIRGMGFGLGGAVPIGARHQVEDGALAVGPGAYCWGGIAGTDVIIDPANDLAMMFATQVLLTGFNTAVNGMMGCSLYSRLVMAALD